jgi:dolichol-phosphate mannosyltransferase
MLRSGAMGVTDVMSSARPSGLELSVVMPVYNESDTVGRVVCAWSDELDRLKIGYELLVYDDGSRDGTAAVLSQLAGTRPRLVVKSHANIGHGPTISKGYREATGAWVFQVDSDDEMTPSGFEQLWARRADYDLLLGCRRDRHLRLARRTISGGSRAVVRVLFGRGLWDVNTPYRLIRKSALTAMVPRIPAGAFAPNVIMAGLAARDRLRIYQIWVAYRQRRVGTGAIAGWRQWRAAFRCAIETASVALHDHRPKAMD